MPETETPVDTAMIDRLGAAFNRCFETCDDAEGALAADVFADCLPPFWRFQVQGRPALLAQLRATTHGHATARIVQLVPTASGFVLEHEVTYEAEQREVARRLWLCEIREGRIAEVVGYCNGGWDDELRARHGTEAPMLRP